MYKSQLLYMRVHSQVVSYVLSNSVSVCCHAQIFRKVIPNVQSHSGCNPGLINTGGHGLVKDIFFFALRAVFVQV